MTSDAEIASKHELEPIETIAQRAGIPTTAWVGYGRGAAKVDPRLLSAEENTPGHVVLVTGMSPTPAGEGKSTVLIGLADALQSLGHRTMAALREPSLGPVMGMKGGAAGGGYSQVVPMENINLHFTGDLHAITSANNTLAALIDNHIHQGNDANLDPRQVVWRRCMDVNDRSLRHTITGLGGRASGVPRETGFDITAASEIMAILCLARDYSDLLARIDRILVGYTYNGDAVTVKELGIGGAVAALLRDAMMPNLVQTMGGTPAFIHGGPFANIAHGCNSVIATRTAQKLADIVVTEAGFGSDLGAEKFVDIAQQAGDFSSRVAVIVVTARSLKYNGGIARDHLNQENIAALEAGLANAARHVNNVRNLGMTPVLAINHFSGDTQAEIEAIEKWAKNNDVAAAVAKVWAEGGDGGRDLAHAVINALGITDNPDTPAQTPHSQALYDPSEGIEAAIETIATSIYKAAKVEYSTAAKKDLTQLAQQGWDTLPVCISKNPFSFSDDPTALGAAEGHTLHVQRLVPRLGAGFVVALTGSVMTMPGLPNKPAAMGISLSEDGEIGGLF